VKKLRVLILTQHDLVPPEDPAPEADVAVARWKTDYDVRNTLRDLGHEVRIVGHDDSLDDVRRELDDVRPHIVFVLLERFADEVRFVPHLLGYLELIGQPYTGCNPIGMAFSNDKSLQRKILRHHRIHTPDFMIVPRGRVVRRPKRLPFPLIVKTADEHGSLGISQSSVVTSDQKLADRVEYIHDSIGSTALIEQFIEGRELYQAVLGNERLETFPLWELSWKNLPEGAPNIATSRLKWDVDYQERVGLTSERAGNLDEALVARIARTCKRASRALEQTGYARFDLRLTERGRVYVIESNPNPEIAWDSEFPSAAKAAGYDYPTLLGRIISLGLRWTRGLRRA
jgi:D-alanine-D-alanine ligase